MHFVSNNSSESFESKFGLCGEKVVHISQLFDVLAFMCESFLCFVAHSSYGHFRYSIIQKHTNYLLSSHSFFSPQGPRIFSLIFQRFFGEDQIFRILVFFQLFSMPNKKVQ